MKDKVQHIKAGAQCTEIEYSFSRDEHRVRLKLEVQRIGSEFGADEIT